MELYILHNSSHGPKGKGIIMCHSKYCLLTDTIWVQSHVTWMGQKFIYLYWSKKERNIMYLKYSFLRFFFWPACISVYILTACSFFPKFLEPCQTSHWWSISFNSFSEAQHITCSMLKETCPVWQVLVYSLYIKG